MTIAPVCAKLRYQRASKATKRRNISKCSYQDCGKKIKGKNTTNFESNLENFHEKENNVVYAKNKGKTAKVKSNKMNKC